VEAGGTGGRRDGMLLQEGLPPLGGVPPRLASLKLLIERFAVRSRIFQTSLELLGLFVLAEGEQERPGGEDCRLG